jgi:osmotically-inducible protein OsmY
MKSNQDLQKDVQEAIKWDPLLKGAEIKVAARDGLITLSGIVKSYLDKSNIETVAKSVYGVNAIIEHITVHVIDDDEISDEALAKSVIDGLKLNWVPIDRIQVKVEHGQVTLDGEVVHHFQKEAAKKAAGNVDGIKVLTNNICVKAETNNELEKRVVEHALLRYSSTADQNIRVGVSGNTITLNGTVYSFYQKEEAAKIAWNAPGVSMVNNELVVAFDN